MTWYQVGKEVVEQQAQIEQEQKDNRPPNRFWLKAGEEKSVVFLDDQGFVFWEHRVQTGQNRWDAFTCLGRQNGCPICAMNSKAQLMTFFTVIDLTKWMNKDGKVIENEKKILALRTIPATSLFKKKERWGGLRFKRIIISRKSDNDYSTGSDFELAMKDDKPIIYNLDPSKEQYQAFSYEKFFAPKSIQEIKMALGINDYVAPKAQNKSLQKDSYMPEFTDEDIVF